LKKSKSCADSWSTICQNGLKFANKWQRKKRRRRNRAFLTPPPKLVRVNAPRGRGFLSKIKSQFMKITIRAKNFKLILSLEEYINRKINYLERFFLNPLEADFRVEIEKTTQHHRKGKVFQALAQIKLPGKIIRAESVSQDLRLAIDEVKDELQQELKKYKEKMLAKRKRNQRSIKKD